MAPVAGMSINRFKGRAASLGFLAGDMCWLDGIFLGVESQFEADAAEDLDGNKALYGIRTDTGSEFWIDQDAFVALEVKKTNPMKLNS